MKDWLSDPRKSVPENIQDGFDNWYEENLLEWPLLMDPAKKEEACKMAREVFEAGFYVGQDEGAWGQG